MPGRRRKRVASGERWPGRADRTQMEPPVHPTQGLPPAGGRFHREMRVILDPSALTHRTVLVTGASGDIGGAVVTALAGAGARVIAHYSRRPEGVPRTDDGRCELVQGDLGSAAGARELWRRVTATSSIDAVVLNAAVIPPTPVDGSDEEWDEGWAQVLAVNLIGTGALMREAVRSFAAQGGGTVVTMSSWAAEQGSRIPDVCGYAASKAAIRNLAQTFARRYVRHGVRSYVIAPAVVDGGMGTAGMDEERLRSVSDGLAMGKFVGKDEIAHLVAFLCTEAAPNLTGATIDLNGASYVR